MIKENMAFERSEIKKTKTAKNRETASTYSDDNSTMAIQNPTHILNTHKMRVRHNEQRSSSKNMQQGTLHARKKKKKIMS